MHSYDNDSDVDRLIRKGFGKLPINEKCIDEATEKILLRTMEHASPKRYIFLPAKRIYWYALAASILIMVGAAMVFLRSVDNSDTKEAVVSLPPVLDPVTVISSINNGPQAVTCGNDHVFKTDKSQLLLGIGQRTRTVVFEKTSLKVLRVDHSTAAVKMNQGTIAVDVKKLTKNDSITIITPFGTFTNVGTRFLVFTDSIRGAGVEVLSGIVRVRDCKGNIHLINAGSVWKSNNADVITSLSRPESDIEHLTTVFDENKFVGPIKWRSVCVTEIPDSSSNRERGKNHSQTILEDQSEESVIQQVKATLSEKQYSTLDSLLLNKFSREHIDSIYDLFLSAADRDHRELRFGDEVRIRTIMAQCQLFSLRKREAASAALLLLHKNTLRTAPATLLTYIRDHREKYINGTFDEDLGAEEATTSIKLGLYNDAIACLKLMLEKYPKSSHGNYWRYTYATMLREHTRRTSDALDAYEMYIVHHPNGTFIEDAMYWTVELSHSLRLEAVYARAKDRYLQNYPSGRWVEEIRAGK